MMDSAVISSNERYSGLDILRALAILVVIPNHIYKELKIPFLTVLGKNGWCGVDLFFVLSGFLMGEQLLKAISQNETKYFFAKFYFKRAFRILPAYWTILAIYYFFPALWEHEYMPSIWKFLTFTQNIGLNSSAFSHAWSLCVEEQFYLILPLLLFFGFGKLRDKQLVQIFVGIAIAGFSVRLVSFSLITPDQFLPYIYYPTWTRLDPLMVGVYLVLIKQFRPQIWSRMTKNGQLSFWVGFFCILLGLSFNKNQNYFLASICFPLIAFGCGGLLLSSLSPSFWLSKARIPGVPMIATLSYGIYLTHKQVAHLMMRVLGDKGLNLNPGIILVLDLIAIFLVGNILYYVVEKPFLNLRYWLQSRLFSKEEKSSIDYQITQEKILI